MNRRRKLFRGMKVGVLLSFVFLLTACSNTMGGSFEKENANKFEAYDVVCYAPKDWSIDESNLSAEFESEDSFAKYNVSFIGEYDKKEADTYIRDFVKKKGYYNENSLEATSVKGCTLAYNVQGKVTSDDAEKTMLWYDRFVLCKGSLIHFHGFASEKYFDKEEFDKIYNASDFSRCEQLKLESISAEYEGTLEDGTVINEECESIKVIGEYNNGVKYYLDGWTIENPKKLQTGNNEFTIKYGDLTCKLSIRVDYKCYEGYDDVIDFSNFSGIEEESHTEDASASSYNTKKKRMNYFYDYKDGYTYKLKSTDKSIVEDYLKELEKKGYKDGTFWLEGQTHWYYNKGEYYEEDYMQILFDLYELDNGEWEFNIYLDIQS